MIFVWYEEDTASRLILCKDCNNDSRKYENSVHLFAPLTVAADLRAPDKVKLLRKEVSLWPSRTSYSVITSLAKI